MQNGIAIRETPNEYLLYIPASQKDRARGIPERRWDPERGCWVYPRSFRMYNLLVSEFGDDLTPASDFSVPEAVPRISPPDRELATREPTLDAKNIRDGINRIDQNLVELLESFSRFLSDPDSQGATVVVERETEIHTLNAKVASLTEDNSHLKEGNINLHDRNKRLEGKVQVLEDEGAKHAQASSGSTQPIDHLAAVRDLALDCIGIDTVFGNQIVRLPITPNLPADLGRIIEGHLREVLKSPGDSLYDLIIQCQDAEKLDEDLVGIAHTIRKQRNVVVHGTTVDDDPRVSMARAVFCLFGAALLLPQLPKN